MGIPENKYHSTIKVEFKDLVQHIVDSDRINFHMYTIHRLLSLGLLIDFPYEYTKSPEPEKLIGVELNLKEHGKVVFLLDIETGYGIVANEENVAVLKNFLEKFGTIADQKQKRKTLF